MFGHRILLRCMSTAVRNKPFYVTTPVFYSNSMPHVGHLYTTLLADAYARHARLVQQSELASNSRPSPSIGSDVVFSTGTDEHGQKVEAAASSRGVPVREWCDKVSSTFSHCAFTFDVSSTVFTRTSSADHGRVVRWMWRRLESRGFIYLGMHEGWYCPSEEAFLTEGNTCTLEEFAARRGGPTSLSGTHTLEKSSADYSSSSPSSSLQEAIASQGALVRDLKARKVDKSLVDAEIKKLLAMKARAFSGSILTSNTTTPSLRVSAESGHPVEWLSEENYKFRLSSLTLKLTKLYTENPDFVLPRERLHSVAAFVQGGEVKDLSVSRKRTRVPWAWEVPEESGGGEHSVYVWLDALCSYLTSTLADGFKGGSEELPQNVPWELLFPAWPADLQIVGKDILKFHALYWPAFLLAAGLPPPKCIVAHGHFTVGKVKMSKSLGNVVCPLSLLQPSYQTSVGTELVSPSAVQTQSFIKGGQYTPEGVRFALLREGIVGEDGDFNGHTLEQRAVKECADTFGNLASRLLTRRFMPLGRVTLAPIPLLLPWDEMKRVGGLSDPLASLGTFIPKEGSAQTLPLTDPQIHLLAHTDTLLSTMERGLKEGRGPYSGLAAIMAVLQEANLVFTSAEPWKLAWSREGGGWQEEVNVWESASNKVAETPGMGGLLLSSPSLKLAALLYTLAETLRVTSILAQLATPRASSLVLGHLGFSAGDSFERGTLTKKEYPGHLLSQWTSARAGVSRPADFRIPSASLQILFSKLK